MKVGMALMWQNVGQQLPDHEVYHDELLLADRAEALGFDSLWTVEHHFTDYCMCPDPVQFLTYMAGRTTRVGLGTMVIVLPWHDPIRVAEQITMLDALSGGRAIVGVGRGLGRVEFEGFGVPMEESRGRFQEAAEILSKSLESGKIDYDGQFFTIPPRDIRPAPNGSFAGRLYAGAVTSDSIRSMAELGYSLLVIPQKPYEIVAADLEMYADVYREIHGREPAPTASALLILCHEDAERAQELGQHYIGNYYRSTLEHYELAGSHFASTSGYEAYSKTANNINSQGVDAATEAFVNLHAFGTPEQVLEKIMSVRTILRADTLMALFKYGGMSHPTAANSVDLFAREVMPALQELRPFA